MKHSLLSLALVAGLVPPVALMAQETEGRRLAELAFRSVDARDRGHIDMGEFSNFGQLVFTSMDHDDSEKISLSEFLNWDFGMLQLAQDRGREDAYDTALRVVFAFWDRNGDDMISKTEHRQSLAFDFQRADIDSNALLTEDEFTTGFSVMVELRAAISPPVTE